MFDKNLTSLPMDPIFKVVKAHKDDPRSEKVNLGIGIYRDTEGAPFVFKSVQEAARRVLVDNFEYDTMQGSASFLEMATNWVLGEGSFAYTAVQQSIGGTHALRLVAEFFEAQKSKPKLLVGTPTWSNHFDVFGAFEAVTFDHLTSDYRLNVEAYLTAIKSNPQSCLILHGGATHNPTGINLSVADLDQILIAANEAEVFVIIDAAYIGFGEGLEADINWVRRAFEACNQGTLAISFSKNASLYNQRLGLLCWKTETAQLKRVLESHLQQLVRATISNLPAYGAAIMEQVLRDNRAQWIEELEQVRLDVNERRVRLVEMIPDTFNFLINTKGLFGLSGLTPLQVKKLRTDSAIYMPPNGRINFASIRTQDFEVLGKALREA